MRHILLLTVLLVLLLSSCAKYSLLTAIVNGDVASVKKMMTSGLSPNEELADGLSAMHVAVINEQPQVLSLLIAYGGDVDAISKDGEYSPLTLTCWNQNHDSLKLLLNAGADANLQLSDSTRALSCYAAKDDTSGVELLLAAGANPNAADSEGWTPIHFAAGNGNAKLVDLLLKSGADPLKRVKYGGNAIDIALTNGHTELADVMKSNCATINEEGSQ